MPIRKRPPISWCFRRDGSCRNPMSPEEIKRIPFKELYPLQLKNEVERKTDKAADTACLQEMAIMFACMKQHEFKEVKCSEEIATFNKCYKDHAAQKKLNKTREEAGEIVVGTNVRSITTKQLNNLLQKYPQFNEKPVKS